jgi:hypothetical protein
MIAIKPNFPGRPFPRRFSMTFQKNKKVRICNRCETMPDQADHMSVIATPNWNHIQKMISIAQLEVIKFP